MLYWITLFTHGKSRVITLNLEFSGITKAKIAVQNLVDYCLWKNHIILPG